MAFDPVSFALGVTAAYVFPCAVLVAICIAEFRKRRKERDRGLNQLMARVAMRCAERPTDSRVN